MPWHPTAQVSEEKGTGLGHSDISELLSTFQSNVEALQGNSTQASGAETVEMTVGPMWESFLCRSTWT